MFSIAGGEQQGNRPLLGHLAQLAECLLPLRALEFGLVATAKLGELLRVMPEPLAQLVTRCYLFEPEINVRLLFRETARPEPFHQHTLPILRRSFLVHALERNMRCVLCHRLSLLS